MIRQSLLPATICSATIRKSSQYGVSDILLFILLYADICLLLAESHLPTIVATRSELLKVLFLALSVTSLFVCEIRLEPLNGLVPNSQGRRVWSLTRTSLNVNVKGEGHQGQKTPLA